jgi:HD-GYP domain-containing protein (c-di-GMP phosphodiesterase class II)
MSFKHLQSVKVFTGDLDVGMFVSALDKPWESSPFLLQGFQLQNKLDVEAVRKECNYVYVDFRNDLQFKKYQCKTTAPLGNKKKIIRKDLQGDFDLKKYAKPSHQIVKKSSTIIKTALDKAMLGEDFDLYSVKSTVKAMVKEVLTNEEAMLMMIMMKNKDGLIARHSLNVSILSIGFARYLGFSEAQVEEIGMGAMLHDIGKVRVDKKALNSTEPLTEKQKQDLCKHSQYSYEILHKKSGLPPGALEIALCHHERLEGQGYPRGLKGHQISQKVRLVSIMDVFEALTSEQPHRKVLSVVESYKILLQGKKKRFDERLVLKLIEWRGIYPAGTIVEMHNGEVGIVVSANRKGNKLKPKILLVLDEDKEKKKKHRLIDLSSLQTDAESKPYKIYKAYESEAFGVNVGQFIEDGLIIATTR